MAWIDYSKVYDFVPHRWILGYLDVLGIAGNVRGFLEKSMKKCKLLLSLNEEDLSEVDVNRGIFQGGSTSPMTFIIYMLPVLFF